MAAAEGPLDVLISAAIFIPFFLYLFLPLFFFPHSLARSLRLDSAACRPVVNRRSVFIHLIVYYVNVVISWLAPNVCVLTTVTVSLMFEFYFDSHSLRELITVPRDE